MSFINADFDNSDIWRPIEGFPGYMVSRYGEVASFRRGDPILMKPFVTQHGYKQVTLCNNGKERMRTVHRLVANAFLGDRLPEHCCVCHKDDNPLNNDVNNLKWGTAKDNHIDAIRNGRLTYRKVYCLQTATLYLSSREAADALCISREAVTRSCSSGLPGPYNLYFCYEEDMDDRLRDVKNWTCKTGAAVKPYYNLRADEVRRLAEQGLRNEEIAKEMGMPVSTVRLWLKRLKEDNGYFKRPTPRKPGAPIYVMNLDTGEVVRYESIKAAAEATGSKNISAVLRKEQKRSGHYTFWYDNTVFN